MLVVEAQLDVLEAIQAALEFEGYGVAAVIGAKGALEALARMGRPGLVLLDETLPEMERARLIRFIRQEPTLRSVPIVLLSVDEHIRLPEVQAVLRKPFNLDRLYTVVRTHCEPLREEPRREEGPARTAFTQAAGPEDEVGAAERWRGVSRK
ncbi:response regulator [Cystobacter fuscus DSM 2262]|uniref:Response regulator n=1 Tax=Cystobacter fuscus (strain ATCC 25194 / DSM 2262 / NBRC 100088 / M29) TaxID=1242864 RepID=S9QF93_CYSF2|nr:response regulator [Cystobacter fuscus DSM 2262]